jgi:hypothetical protein
VSRGDCVRGVRHDAAPRRHPHRRPAAGADHRLAVALLGEQRPLASRAADRVAGTIVAAAAASSSGSWSLAGDIVAVISLVLNAGWFTPWLRTSFEIDPFAFMLGTLTCGALLMTPLALIVHGSLGLSGRGLFFAAARCCRARPRTC